MKLSGFEMNESITTPQAVYLLGAQPKATLLHATPEWVIAQATRGYAGKYTAQQISGNELDDYWAELGATALKGPLEMATTFWLIENVSRAFTHQLARYRQGASMVQESQRFSVQVMTQDVREGNRAVIMVPANVAQDADSLEDFVGTAEECMKSYHAMIAGGKDVQDARAILPTHICTRLYLSVNMSGLRHIYHQRTCCQAQHGEWTEVMDQMKTMLGMKGFTHYFNTLQAPWEDPKCISCGFGANFDRPCKHQDKFDHNLMENYLTVMTNEERFETAMRGIIR